MQINEIFELAQYDEAYKFVLENKISVIKDLGDEKYQIIELPQPTLDELASLKRLERDMVLAKSDFMFNSDYPVTTENESKLTQYRQYRQYLRDIPAHVNFPKVEIMTFDEWLSIFCQV